jgi:hypothetical protein
MQRWRGSIRVAMVVVGVYYVVFGIWALAEPASFYGQIASFSPFNAHFLHDAGAFQVGLGLALILVVMLSDAILAVALSVGIASLLHVVAHIVDINLGGQPGRDIAALAALTAVLGAVAAARIADQPRQQRVR